MPTKGGGTRLWHNSGWSTAAVNSLTGNGAYMCHFFDELHWRLTISMNTRTPTTYVSDYEMSTFWLQHRSTNHPPRSKYEGAVPLRKFCVEWTFFCTILYNMPFPPIMVNRPWRPLALHMASWCPIWSTSSSNNSYWSPLATDEGLVPQAQEGVLQNSSRLR